MTSRSLMALGLALLAGCAGGDTSTQPGKETGDTPVDTAVDTGEADSGDTSADTAPDPATLDQDGDGFSPNDGDCDDERAHVYPGAVDYCDGLDADCDGEPIPDGSCGVVGDPAMMWTWSFDGCASYICHPWASLGDVDGDARDDVAFRAGYSESNGSELGVLSSSAAGNWQARQPPPVGVWVDNFPEWNVQGLTSAGDFNGDGTDDVWVYTQSDAGYTGGMFLMLGRLGGFGEEVEVVDEAADAMWLDAPDHELYGDELTGVGDINDDGLSDAVIALYDSHGASFAWILGADAPHGRHDVEDIPQLKSEYPVSDIGKYDGLVVDLDGDGIGELATTTSRVMADDSVIAFVEAEDLQDGASLGDLAQDAWYNGPEAVDVGWYGRPATNAGDIDGDGLNDMALNLMTVGDAGVSYCVGVFTGGVPTGEINSLMSVQVCGLDDWGVRLIDWQDDVDDDGIRDLHAQSATWRGTLPTTRLRDGGVQIAEDIVGAQTDPLLSLTATADFNGDGLPEWVFWDSTWVDPSTREEVGRTLILAGFEIPWDDPTKW